ncbi:hypothetical protein QP271_25710, partial [Escherichia coli]|nr:hypothetical protein [Escherichia coli]
CTRTDHSIDRVAVFFQQLNHELSRTIRVLKMVAHEDNKRISNLAVVVDKTLHLSEVDVTWLSTHGFTHLLYLAFSHSFSLEVSLENS